MTPSTLHGALAVARLSQKRMLRGSRLRIALLVTTLLVAGIATVFHLGQHDDAAEALQGAMNLGFFNLLCFLLPFMFAAGAISEEASSRTLPYLFARPLPRYGVALGKFFAAVVITVGLAALAVVVLYVACFITEPSQLTAHVSLLGRVLLAVVLLTAYYTAVCVFWSAAVPEAAGIATTVHFAVLEYGVGAAPGAMRLLSLNHAARCVAGVPAGGFMADSIPTVPLWASIALLLFALGVAVALALLATQVREYRMGKAA